MTEAIILTIMILTIMMFSISWIMAAKNIKYELQQARIESQTLLKTVIDAHVDSERLIDSLNKSSDAVAWVSSKNSIT